MNVGGRESGGKWTITEKWRKGGWVEGEVERKGVIKGGVQIAWISKAGLRG